MKAVDLIQTSPPEAAPRPKPKRRKVLPLKVDGPYLKGPIPWQWVTRAGCIPSRALHVGLAIWKQAGITRFPVVAINQTRIARDFGVDRSTVHRAIEELEKAGLVRVVERKRGSRVKVELLGIDTDDEFVGE